MNRSLVIRNRPNRYVSGLNAIGVIRFFTRARCLQQGETYKAMLEHSASTPIDTALLLKGFFGGSVH